VKSLDLHENTVIDKRRNLTGHVSTVSDVHGRTHVKQQLPHMIVALRPTSAYTIDPFGRTWPHARSLVPRLVAAWAWPTMVPVRPVLVVSFKNTSGTEIGKALVPLLWHASRAGTCKDMLELLPPPPRGTHHR
jgi:hypothetical protein